MSERDRPPAPGDLAALDHVILAVADLPAARAAYARLLGRDPAWVGEHPGQGTENALFALERTMLEVVAPVADGPFAERLRAHLDARGDGLFGLAFGCADLDACVESLRARGLHPAPVSDGEGRNERGDVRRWRFAVLPEDETIGIPTLAIERPAGTVLPMPPARGPTAAAVSRIDHVVLRTRDADRAIGLYRDGLGLRLALDRTFPDWGARLVFFRVGGVTLELAQALSPDDTAHDDHLWGISWRGEDGDAAHARLRAEGFSLSDVRTGRRPGTRVFTVHDAPHGVATLYLAAR